MFNCKLDVYFLFFLSGILVIFVLYSQLFTIKDESKIPRIVHLSWKSREIPTETVEYIKQWRRINPDWQVWFWDDITSGDFVHRQYPELISVYDNYPKPIYRSDMSRYLWLYTFGGVWADLDIEPLKSLEPIRDKYPCIISQEHVIHTRKWNVDMMACNAFMMCRKRHPFFALVIELLHVNQKFEYPITATGPLMLTRMFKAYNQMKDTMTVQNGLDEIFLADVEMFMPRADVLSVQKLLQECENGSIRPHYRYLCLLVLEDGYLTGPTSQSFVDHHWWHSWLPHNAANIQSRNQSIPIEEVLPDVVFPQAGVHF